MQLMATKGFQGQHRPYGDYIYEYKVEASDCSMEDIANFCKFVLNKQHLPEKNEWSFNLNNGEDMGYYAQGYYTISPLSGEDKAYMFTIHKPYMD